MILDLPPKSKELFDALFGKSDVSIDDLFVIVSNSCEIDPRTRQQFVGSCISRLNRRIRRAGLRAVPGSKKRTYTLTRLD